MTKNSDNVSSSCSAAGQKKCTPVCLLLFVGFIFGFSVGFASHDVIYKTLSKAMYGNKQLVSPPISTKNISVSDEDAAVETGTPDVEGPAPSAEPAEPSAPAAEAEAPKAEEAKPEETATE